MERPGAAAIQAACSQGEAVAAPALYGLPQDVAGGLRGIRVIVSPRIHESRRRRQEQSSSQPSQLPSQPAQRQPSPQPLLQQLPLQPPPSQWPQAILVPLQLQPLEQGWQPPFQQLGVVEGLGRGKSHPTITKHERTPLPPPPPPPPPREVGSRGQLRHAPVGHRTAEMFKNPYGGQRVRDSEISLACGRIPHRWMPAAGRNLQWK